MKYFSSIVWCVLENHGYNTAIQLSSHQRLLKSGAVLTNYTATQHPSGPNYRDLAAGNHWRSDEFIGEEHPTIATSLAASPLMVLSLVIHWKGQIADRHDPFLDLKSSTGLHYGDFDPDKDFVPAVDHIYIGFDDSNNAHSGPIEVADANLNALLEKLDHSVWFNTPFKGKYPALFVVWDEDLNENPQLNHVFAAWYGKGVKTGQVATQYNHLSFCRTVTDNYGLPPLENAAKAQPMEGIWL